MFQMNPHIMSLLDIPEDVLNIIFTYLNYDTISLNVFAYVSKMNYVSVSKYSISNNIHRRFKIEDVALNGYLDVLKWALKNRYRWNKRVCANAAKNNHIDLLKYAREHESDW